MLRPKMHRKVGGVAYIRRSMTRRTLSLPWMRRRRPLGCTSSMLMGVPIRSFSSIRCQAVRRLAIVYIRIVFIFDVVHELSIKG